MLVCRIRQHLRYIRVISQLDPERLVALTVTVIATVCTHEYIPFSVPGTKCLSGTERLAGVAGGRQGILLHDSHAEVLARRGLLRWIMAQIRNGASCQFC